MPWRMSAGATAISGRSLTANKSPHLCAFMPRVTIICNSFPPETGGAPGRIYNLAKLLVQDGYKVQVITAMPNYPLGAIFPGYRGKMAVRETIDGIEVKRIVVYPSNSGRLFPRAVSMISHVLSLWLLAFPGLFFRRPDVTIVSSPPLLAAYAGMQIARLSSRKVILNVSDIWPLSAVEMGALRKGWRFRVLQRVEKSMYRMAVAFMGQSEEIIQHIHAFSRKKKPSFLYRNLQAQRQDSNALRQRTGERKIIYAGMLGHAQGMLHICRTVDFAACGAKLYIYGNGPERKPIEAWAAQHPEKGITVHDTISSTELSKLLPSFDATLIPLKHPIAGAVPSKLFLAIAHQLPVLFCAGGEGEEITKRYGLGWVSAPGNGAALEKNIHALSALDDASWRLLKDRMKGAADGAFSAGAQGKNFLAFLKRVLK